MKQSVVICDGNPLHLSYLRQTLEEYDSEGRYEVSGFSDGDLLAKALSNQEMHLLFLDMSMSGGNSIHLGKLIREKYPEVLIILMTESDTFSLGAYALRASYYLQKPVMAHKIHAILDEIGVDQGLKPSASHRLQWISIQTKKKSVRVACQDIRYIEKNQRKVVVHTLTDSWDFYGTFKDVRTQLDMEETFVQCHQGFIVNLSRISELESDGLKLSDGTWIPVSRHYRPFTENAFLRAVRSQKKE